jgi:hypothetical protein
VRIPTIAPLYGADAAAQRPYLSKTELLSKRRLF